MDNRKIKTTPTYAIPVKAGDRKRSSMQTIFKGTEFVRTILNHINDFKFIYDVNFNAGRGKLTFSLSSNHKLAHKLVHNYIV